ncbi:MAG: hemerythrin family protein [Holophagaceae bacterium]|nr:hemerythrin family protein [Holophagaceae bacterium]
MFFKSAPKPQPPTAFFPWLDEEYTVGIQRFDRAHQRLASRINDLHEAMMVKRDRLLATAVFTKLIQETRAHFVDEESILTQFNFPDSEAHFAEHSDLLQEAAEFLRKYEAGNLSALVLLNTLKAWLINHIKNSDRKYTGFLRRQRWSG